MKVIQGDELFRSMGSLAKSLDQLKSLADGHCTACGQSLDAANILQMIHEQVEMGEPCPICSSAPHLLNCALVLAIAKMEEGK